MAERSRPWDGIVTGDAGPYSFDQWTDIFKTLLAPTIAREGVLQGQLNEFLLSSVAATPVSVASGRALVNGIWYESDAATSVAIPTPAANPRVDRIVARAGWVAQTVRITRVAGAEAASPVPPALVQIDGTTWDLPLWQVHATTGAVLTFFRDERSLIGQYEPGASSDTLSILESEMYLGPLIISASQAGIPWSVQIVGSYALDPLTQFAGGGIGFRANAGVTGHLAYFSSLHRPDLGNNHTVIFARNPGSDADLDRMIGFSGSLNDVTPTNGVMFRSVGAGNWFAVTRLAGVETVTDTGQALDSTWRKFEIKQHENDVVTFLIDGVVVATHQTDIPVTSMHFLSAVVDNGTNPADITYMQVGRMKTSALRPT